MTRITSSHLPSNGRPSPDAREENNGRALRDIDLDNRPQPIVLTIGGTRRELGPDDFDDDATIRRLWDASAGAQEITWDITPLIGWAEFVARDVIRTIGEMPPQQRVTIIAGEVSTNSIFQAALGLVRDYERLAQITSSIDLAVLAAIIEHPADLPAARGRIIRRIRSCRIQGFGLRDVQRRIDQLTEDLRRNAPDDPPAQICELLTQVPYAEDYVLPVGFRIREEGIAYDGQGTVIGTPIVISRILTDVESGREAVELSYRHEGGIRNRIVERTVIAVAREITQLSAYGIGITSNSASDAVRYFAEFEQANRHAIPRTRMTKHLGWQGVNFDAFLLGTEVVTSDPVDSQVDPGQVDGQELTFVGESDGEQQLVDGFRRAGSIEVWLRTMEPLHAYPRVLFAIYASLAAVLLPILNAANFIVSFAGGTSGGKTTTLRIAASVWGDPDEQHPASVMGAWDVSRVWIERTLATLNSLVFIMDDTKRARRGSDVAQTVYDVCSGRGRGRGDIRGTVRNSTWRTIMLTNGEAPLTSFSGDGGTRARILEVWGSPFGGTSEAIGSFVNAVDAGIKENFGHAGLMFVRHLTSRRAEWPSLRQRFAELRAIYRQRAGTNTVAGRMAPHFAVLRLAELLVHEAVPLPWPCGNIVDGLWPELISETQEADRAASALAFVLQWASAHRGEFVDVQDTPPNRAPPIGGWAGRWRVAARSDEDALGIFPYRLDQLLRDEGYEPAAVRLTWRDRGWLRHGEGKTTLKARVDRQSNTVELVAIRWSTIREHLEEGAEPRLRSTVEDRPRIGGGS